MADLDLKLNSDRTAPQTAPPLTSVNPAVQKYEQFMQNLKQKMQPVEVAPQKSKEFDYLDYEENEKRLKDLLNNNNLDRFRSLVDPPS